MLVHDIHVQTLLPAIHNQASPLLLGWSFCCLGACRLGVADTTHYCNRFAYMPPTFLFRLRDVMDWLVAGCTAIKRNDLYSFAARPTVEIFSLTGWFILRASAVSLALINIEALFYRQTVLRLKTETLRVFHMYDL